MSGFFEILQGLQELQSGREIAYGQTDGHRGANIIRPIRRIIIEHIYTTGFCNKTMKVKVYLTHLPAYA